jgi:hypothetical protein
MSRPGADDRFVEAAALTRAEMAARDIMGCLEEGPLGEDIPPVVLAARLRAAWRRLSARLAALVGRSGPAVLKLGLVSLFVIA